MEDSEWVGVGAAVIARDLGDRKCSKRLLYLVTIGYPKMDVGYVTESGTQGRGMIKASSRYRFRQSEARVFIAHYCRWYVTLIS